MARRRKSKQSNDIVKYSVIGVAVLATLMLVITFAPTGQFFNIQTYEAYGYNAYNEDPADFALDTFFKFSAMQPKASDHDGDGAADFRECPSLFSDSDSDGIEDIVETIQTGTDPNNADTDGDGYVDGMDSHPLDSTLPIPPTVAPTDPGTGDDDGDLTPEDGAGEIGPGLGDGKKIPEFGGGSGFRTQINNLLTGAFLTGAMFHEGGLGDKVIVLKPVAEFTYDPESPTVGQTIEFDGSESNADLVKGSCSNLDYNANKAECESYGQCTYTKVLVGEVTEEDWTAKTCLGTDATFTAYVWNQPTIDTYKWEFGNEIVSSGMSTTNIYDSEGDFDVKLTVTTTNSLSNSLTQTLTIGPRAAPPPAPAGIGATVADPVAEGLLVLDWITDKTLAGNFRNCPDNPNDITKGNGIPDIIDRGSDYDGDGWTDYYEFRTTGDAEALDNPPHKDGDNDGFNDQEEAEAGSDPSSPTSLPAFTGEGETSLIVSDDITNTQCSLLIRPAETRNALAILKITDAGTVTGFVYQTRALESGIAQTLTIDKPSTGDLCEGFLWEDWSGTSLATKVEVAI